MLALERYNALLRPASQQYLYGGLNTIQTYFKCHCVRLIKYVGPIVILSSLYYVPKWMELRVAEFYGCYRNNVTYSCSLQHYVKTTKLRKSNDYVLWCLNISNLIVTSIVPMVALMYLNFNIYIKFKQFQRRQPSLRLANNAPTERQLKVRKREKDMVQQTRILFVIVILFVLSHVLRITLNIEEFITLEDSNKAKDNGCIWIIFWTYLAAPISHILLLINSSVNLFIYCYFNQSFRDVLVSWLRTIFKKLTFRRKIIGYGNTRSNVTAVHAQGSRKSSITTTNAAIAESIELNVKGPIIEDA